MEYEIRGKIMCVVIAAPHRFPWHKIEREEKDVKGTRRQGRKKRSKGMGSTLNDEEYIYRSSWSFHFLP